MLQEQLGPAVLQRQPVVYRKDREVARPAHDVASTGDERDVAVTAGGGRDGYGVRPVVFSSFLSIPLLPQHHQQGIFGYVCSQQSLSLRESKNAADLLANAGS
jgi:hypothetical protein